MSQIVHEFTVHRQDTEYELRALFDITPSEPQRSRRRTSRLPDIDPEIGGRAELAGEIFLVEGVLWDGRLTKREQEKIEADALEAWADSQEPSDRSSPFDDDTCSFDDNFDDSMALSVQGKGMVDW
jgi:hypothetical protein